MQSNLVPKHKVAPDGDLNIQYYRDNRSKFGKIRVVVHTTGPWPNSQTSGNHVSVYLLLEERGSVRINMTTDEGDTAGYIVWS